MVFYSFLIRLSFIFIAHRSLVLSLRSTANFTVFHFHFDKSIMVLEKIDLIILLRLAAALFV